MHSNIILSGLSVFFALGNAVPLNNGKRDIVWVTEVETAVETVPITTTVWVDPTDVPVAHNHRHRHSSSSSKAAIEVKPTPSPSSSSSSEESYVAPSSYEAPSTYVAPTTTAAPEPVTTAQAEQTTSSPEPETTQAAVTPESSYVAPVSSYEAPSSTYVAPVSSYEAPSSTSVYVAPSSTSVYEAPTSTYEAPAASSSAPASYSSGSSDGNPASGKSFTGEMTYFTPGMGACGHDSSESEHMVAVSMALFDQYTPNGNPNNNPLCGKTLTITSPDGSSHEATIWDRCVGCAEADLDMPQSFFNVVTAKDGKPADGRAYGMSWSMN